VSQRLYVSLFVALAICFVPVLLFLGMITKIAPVLLLAVGAYHDGFFLGAAEAATLLIHLLFYLVFFYAIARGSYLVTSKISGKAMRTGMQSIILLVLFSTSFIPILEQDSYAGNSRYQTFWSALNWYFGKKE
jgi:hypothetical protein